MPLYGFIIALLPESPYPFIRSRTPGPVLRALYPSFYLSSFLRAPFIAIYSYLAIIPH